MIFVTVGTANKGFDRLIEECDLIAGKHNIDFFAQIGSSKYQPKNFPFKDWLSRDDIKERYKLADAFIVHGGFGTLSEVLRLGKPIIVVPRSFEDGEAVNDQKDISLKLDTLGYVKSVLDIDQLEEVIIHLNKLNLASYTLTSDIPEIINQQINLIRNSL